MFVLCNIYKSIDDLLPHFYKHYMSLGITEFAFGVFDGERNPMWNHISEITPPSIRVNLMESYSGSIEPNKERETWEKLNEKFISLNDWYVIADLDEFHVIPNVHSFDEAKLYCESEGSTYILGNLIDRFTEDGIIPPNINPTISIFDQFPKNTCFSQNTLHACTEKVCMAKQTEKIYVGHHFCSGKQSSLVSHTYHFKWFGNLYEKEKEKWISYKESNYNFSKENEKSMELFENTSQHHL